MQHNPFNEEPTRNPENYRWALFYYNPKDSRIFVPKRFGIGYTLNFSKAASWLFLAAIGAMIYYISKLNS